MQYNTWRVKGIFGLFLFRSTSRFFIELFFMSVRVTFDVLERVPITTCYNGFGMR